MKKARYILYLIAGMILTGCSETTGSDVVPAEEDMPMLFSSASSTSSSALNASMGKTRAYDSMFVDGSTITNIPANDSVGVFGYSTGTSDWTTDDQANFMFDQLMKRTSSGNGMTYTPLRYWGNDGRKYSFYGYYPYTPLSKTLHGVSITTDDMRKGMGSLGFTVNTDAAKQIDFLVSELAANKTINDAGDSSVVLKFRHVLSQLNVKLSYDTINWYNTKTGLTTQQVLDSSNKLYIYNVVLSGIYNTGKVSPVASPTANGDYVWAYVGDSPSDSVTIRNYSWNSDNTNALLIIPQRMPVTATITFYGALYTNGTMTKLGHITYAFTSSVKNGDEYEPFVFLPGRKYTVRADIKQLNEDDLNLVANITFGAADDPDNNSSFPPAPTWGGESDGGDINEAKKFIPWGWKE
ncbi:MAG: fimbrillin family protein [Prevotella sp.]